MTRPLSHKAGLLHEHPTRKIDAIRERLSREGKDLYLLSTGQPSIPPPYELRKYLSDLLLEEDIKLYSYTPSGGLEELREAIAYDMKILSGISLDPRSEIAVTTGGQEGMFITLSTILDEDDEVILFEPAYFGYKPLIEYLGCKVTSIATSLEDKFQPNIEMLKDMITSKTKAIIIVSPDNPTGRIINVEVAKAIADLAVDHDLWIVYDEAYKTIIYEGEHLWMYKLAPERTIAINAFSKDPGVPGWRIGYIYGPSEVVKAARLMSENISYCPPSFSQISMLYYLKRRLREKFLKEVLEIYKSRRDVLVEELENKLPDARFIKPKGSMFIFVDFSKYLKELRTDSEGFAKNLLLKCRVAVIPGTYFGSSCKDFIRLSFVAEPEDRLRKAIKVIREYIELLK